VFPQVTAFPAVTMLILKGPVPTNCPHFS
jgi:hypothetical protein